MPLSVWCLIGALDNFLFGVIASSPVLLFAFFIINLFRRDKGDFWAVFFSGVFDCLRAPWLGLRIALIQQPFTANFTGSVPGIYDLALACVASRLNQASLEGE